MIKAASIADLAPVVAREVLAVLLPRRAHDRDQEQPKREIQRDRAGGPDADRHGQEHQLADAQQRNSDQDAAKYSRADRLTPRPAGAAG